MLVGWLIVADCLAVFTSSKDDTLADTLDLWRPFLQLGFLYQKLRTLGPPLWRAVQVASVHVLSSL